MTWHSTLTTFNSINHLFILLQIHTEAVTGIVGRAELLASIWYLLALLTFARSSRKRPPHQTRWLKLLEVMMYVTLAVLCKEQGITVVAVCLCHELFINQKLSVILLKWQQRTKHLLVKIDFKPLDETKQYLLKICNYECWNW